MGINSVNHQIEQDYHSLIIRDSDEGILYVFNLGAEDERTLYKWQVEGTNQTLRDTSNPRYQLIKPEASQQALFHLVNNPHPIPMHSNIHIKPIDTDLTSIDPEDLFSFTPGPFISIFNFNPDEICSFINKTQKWAEFIEDGVNAMAEVKGIPQSGKLTLLPPEDIPQV